MVRGRLNGTLKPVSNSWPQSYINTKHKPRHDTVAYQPTTVLCLICTYDTKLKQAVPVLVGLCITGTNL